MFTALGFFPRLRRVIWVVIFFAPAPERKKYFDNYICPNPTRYIRAKEVNKGRSYDKENACGYTNQRRKGACHAKTCTGEGFVKRGNDGSSSNSNSRAYERATKWRSSLQ